MTGTVMSIPYAKPAVAVMDFLPAVAQFDPIAPTSAGFGMSSSYPWRGMEVTSGSVDTSTALAIIGAAGWLTATLKLGSAPTRIGIRAAEGAAVMLIASRTLGAPHSVPTTSVPDEVRCLRNEIQRSTGMSRQEIARLIGVDRRSLSAWASGETPPSDLNLVRLNSLADLARQLSERGAVALSITLRHAATSARVTAAIRTGNVDQAVRAVLAEADAQVHEDPPSLTPEQWNVLVKLVTESGPEEISDPGLDEYGSGNDDHRSRLRLDPSAYGTPRRRPRPPVGK